VTREIILAPEALTDLFDLYDYIAANSGAERARHYTDRIVGPAATW
jgi:plasmid stabilization system protein ParE